jgi:serine/threonine protein kinase
MPNGGIAVDDYLYNNGSFEKIYLLHKSLFNLLKEGIIPMNKRNIYHCDIKDSNILADDSTSELKTRLIDWGLANEYNPFKNEAFPRSWRNRPFQYNVPFSVIIFSEFFIEKYTEYIKNGGSTDEIQLKPFVIDYIKFWFKKRGAGHYKFINEIMYTFFSKNLKSISSENKPAIIETQITMEYIVNYIVDVLVHFTKFREDGKLNLRDYLDNVFIKISDIWGFISVYYPIAEILYNNYDNLSQNELNIFNKIKYIFVTYLFNPRHEPINMNMLYSDLKNLGELIYFNLKSKNGTIRLKRKSFRITKFANNSDIHKKTRKNKSNNKYINKKISFKRRPKRRKFKNPIFLSLK